MWHLKTLYCGLSCGNPCLQKLSIHKLTCDTREWRRQGRRRLICSKNKKRSHMWKRKEGKRRPHVGCSSGVMCVPCMLPYGLLILYISYIKMAQIQGPKFLNRIKDKNWKPSTLYNFYKTSKGEFSNQNFISSEFDYFGGWDGPPSEPKSFSCFHLFMLYL